MVALFEAQALFGSPTKPGGVIANPARPLVTLPISVTLSDVVDLTDGAQSALIGTNAQELTGDWQAFGTRPISLAAGSPHAGVAPTQQLAVELFRIGAKGFITFSAKVPEYKVLGIFTQHLVLGTDKVEYSFHDMHGALQAVTIP